MVMTASGAENREAWQDELQRVMGRHRVPVTLVEESVRVRLNEPDMDAAIRAVSVCCASVPPPLFPKREAVEALLVRLLRSRMRLVRTEFHRRKLRYASEEERLDYKVKERPVAYLQLYLLPEEVRFVREGLELLGRRLERGLSAVEDRLLLRCTTLDQAIHAGKSPHAELVRVLNRRRGAPSRPQDGPRSGRKKDGTHPDMRLRFREWTVRAAVFGIVSYMRYTASPPEWRRAYKLLEKMVRLHRDVIASQVRHGKPGYRLLEGLQVKQGLGIEPSKQAYVTPRLGLQDLRVMREGLELRSGELARAAGSSLSPRYRLNPTEEVLLLKSKLLYDASYGVGERRIRWRWGRLPRERNHGPNAIYW